MLVLVVAAMPAGASPSMQSTGSSFASPAIQSWVGQAATLYGLNINWQVQSSVIGLNDFAQNQVDFGASDIPYSAGQATYAPTIPYEYLPDVAGGLAFMYNLTGQDGQRITSLRLNASVLDSIFLGEIAYWDNPAIVSLNPQLQGDLPHTSILPVYRSDASGENYLLSDYMLHQDRTNFVTAQDAFGDGSTAGSPSANWPIPVNGPGSVSATKYPLWEGGLGAQNGSDNAANYVSAASSNGAITYVETAYAIEHHLPVASIINAKGNAVQPTSLNVATALEAAILNPDLTQNLTNVYTNPLPNAYPLSAYSYFVTPCSPTLAAAQHSSCAADPGGAPSTFPAAKGQALGKFLAYVPCLGQQQMVALGYSPLPPNLVQEDFYAIGRLNGAVEPAPVSSATCRNPYVDGQIPLPGEPSIIGQQGGGISGTLTTVPGAAPTAGGSGGQGVGTSATTAASTTSNGGGQNSSAGSGGGSSSGAAAGKIHLSASQIASGLTVVNGHIVKSLNGPGEPNKYLRADGLVTAFRGVDGLSVGALIGWLLVIAAALAVPPTVVWIRRRRAHTSRLLSEAGQLP